MGELGAFLSEQRALRRSGVAATRAPRAFGSATVLLLPGFGLPARSLVPLGRWLAQGGWTTTSAPIGWNVGCGEAAVEIVVHALEQRAGAPVPIVGHSRGGLIGRVVAVRRPDLVAGLVTVCTPWALGPPDRPGVATVAEVVRFARRHGLATMGSIDCAAGACCQRFRAEVVQVPEAPWTALWSSTDSIGRADSVPPDGPGSIVDLRTSHLGSVRSVAGWTAIGAAIASFGSAAPG